MRAAMAAAEVGDDVLDRDPTMLALERRVADLLGMGSALWVPSGTMGNLIAAMFHLRRGERFLAPERAHILAFESGTAAWLAGGMPEALPWARPGRPDPELVRTLGTADREWLPTRLLCLENTHNVAGGTVTPVDEHQRLVAAARAADLRIHLDGARLWNAAIALDVPPHALTEGVDTVQVCLSKGLGVPVGALVCGDADFRAEAVRLRRMLGGAVRQGGILAAAGLTALDRLDSLREDHEKARLLADGLRAAGWETPMPETNIVMARPPEGITPDCLARVGVSAFAFGSMIRFVTHRDVSRCEITEAVNRVAELPGKR